MFSYCRTIDEHNLWAETKLNLKYHHWSPARLYPLLRMVATRSLCTDRAAYHTLWSSSSNASYDLTGLIFQWIMFFASISLSLSLSLCCTQAWTPSCLPSTSTTPTWTAGWREVAAPRCPTSSRSPRRASAACWRSPLRGWAASWGRSAPSRPWCPDSRPEGTERRTRYPFFHAAPLLVGNGSWYVLFLFAIKHPIARKLKGGYLL